MARRAGLLTTEDVLEELEDDFDVDEPMMPGSDDEFSDLEDIEDIDDDNDDNDSLDTPNPPPPNQNSASDTLPTWSTTLTPVTVPPFTSPVGPKVPIPESPSDTFEMMFTP